MGVRLLSLDRVRFTTRTHVTLRPRGTCGEAYQIKSTATHALYTMPSVETNESELAATHALHTASLDLPCVCTRALY